MLCLCSSARICSTPLRIYSYLCLSESSRIHAFALLCASMPLHCQGQPGLSMPLRCIAERRVSALRHCDALPPTPRPALPSLFDTRPCISFALLVDASLIQAIYAYLRRCVALLSFAFAPRCTAVTTCAPAEQTCQHNAVAEFCAHIRAFAKLLQAIQRLCKSYHCRSRSNPIHAMPLLSR